MFRPLIPYSRIGINSFVRVSNSAMSCSSACAREELICAKRASLGTVVLDEAIDFDELGGDIAGATPSAGVAQPPTWRCVLVTSFRMRIWSSAILRRAGTQVNLHATRSLKCRLLACRYWLRRICRGRRGTSGGAGPQRFLSVPSYGVS